MLKIRRPLGRLIFNMGIAIPGKTVFLIETAPCIGSGNGLAPNSRQVITWTNDDCVSVMPNTSYIINTNVIETFIIRTYAELPSVRPVLFTRRQFPRKHFHSGNVFWNPTIKSRWGQWVYDALINQHMYLILLIKFATFRAQTDWCTRV